MLKDINNIDDDKTESQKKLLKNISESNVNKIFIDNNNNNNKIINNQIFNNQIINKNFEITEKKNIFFKENYTPELDLLDNFIDNFGNEITKVNQRGRNFFDFLRKDTIEIKNEENYEGIFEDFYTKSKKYENMFDELSKELNL